MTAHRKTIEYPTGHGEIRLRDGQTVKVRYALVALPAYRATTGELEIWGALHVNQGQGLVELSGKTFTLITDDRRCLEARAKSGDPVSGLWEIVAVGPKGLTPC